MPSTPLSLGNKRLTGLATSPIRAFNQQLQQVEGLIPLTIGEPDFDVDQQTKEAAVHAVLTGDAHYSSGYGTPELLAAIANDLKERVAVNYQPDTEIVVTLGVSEGLFVTLQALFNPGDIIIVPTPTFSLYESLAKMLGLQVITINTAPNFVLQPDMLEKVLRVYPNARAIALNSPGNPTGVVYTKEQLEALAVILKKYDTLAISDDIYAAYTYEGVAPSIASILPEQTIIVSGLSKSHAMPGYRIGYVAGPKDLVQLVGKVHRSIVTSAPNPMMAAATTALTVGAPIIDRHRALLQQRRNRVLRVLDRLNLTHAPAHGAFYIFVKIPDKYQDDDVAFAVALAKQAKIGVMPGSIFGAGGEGYIRLSYAVDDAQLDEAMHRLEQFI